MITVDVKFLSCNDTSLFYVALQVSFSRGGSRGDQSDHATKVKIAQLENC
jgi:hypothetical protein